VSTGVLILVVLVCFFFISRAKNIGRLILTSLSVFFIFCLIVLVTSKILDMPIRSNDVNLVLEKTGIQKVVDTIDRYVRENRWRW
jgi:uncharacterized membrane protein